MRNQKWVRLLAYVTGSVNQELLLQNEYLAAENRILICPPQGCDGGYCKVRVRTPLDSVDPGL